MESFSVSYNEKYRVKMREYFWTCSNCIAAIFNSLADYIVNASLSVLHWTMQKNFAKYVLKCKS